MMKYHIQMIPSYKEKPWLAKTECGKFLQRGDTPQEAINNLKRLMEALQGK